MTSATNSKLKPTNIWTVCYTWSRLLRRIARVKKTQSIKFTKTLCLRMRNQVGTRRKPNLRCNPTKIGSRRQFRYLGWFLWPGTRSYLMRPSRTALSDGDKTRQMKKLDFLKRRSKTSKFATTSSRCRLSLSTRCRLTGGRMIKPSKTSKMSPLASSLRTLSSR